MSSVKEKIKVICEQIFSKESKLKTNKGCYFQQNGQWSWCVGTPIYLKHCAKNQAQELKTLFQSIQQDLGKFGAIPYPNWLSKDNQNDSELKAGGGKVIANNYNEFIQELDEIVGNAERDNHEPRHQPNNHEPRTTNLGEDYASLKSVQQQGRQKTQNSWTNKKNISFLCFHCQKAFPYDKSISNYCEARNKAKNELNAHKNSCSYDNNTNEGKLKAQQWWSEIRNSKTRIIKTCEKCWGKVLWDKLIIGADEARVQALSDFKYHQEHECHLVPNQRTIAIYHSPNQGGNQHAPMDTSLLHPDADDGIFSQDNDGETYHNQGTQPNKFNWKPWAIGVSIVLTIGIAVYFFFKNKQEN